MLRPLVQPAPLVTRPQPEGHWQCATWGVYAGPVRAFVAGALFLAACSTGPDCTLVPTPIGLFPSACVIVVSNGNNLPAVVMATYAPCSCPLPAPDCTLLPTPGGYAPKACVIEVPNDATVSDTPDGGTVVSLNGRVLATYPPCPCARPDGGFN